MSFKYIVEKISDNHYVLPKVGKMNCEVHAFLNEKLYQMSEEACWSQAHNAASYPGVTAVYLQPDTHSGFGVPIGCVIVTEDVIIQACNGYDLSCGIIHIRYPDLHASDIASIDKRQRLVKEIEKRATFGVGSSRPELIDTYNDSAVKDILQYGAKALGVDKDLCEREYLPVSDGLDTKLVADAFDKAKSQLGSVGSGNHYTEVQCDSVTGEVWVMIHCGSRGYGYKTAEHFFYASAELRGIPKAQRESSWLRIDEPMGKQYWDYMSTAANYAIANRHIIVNGVNEAMRKVFKVDGEVYYEISHNLCQEEVLVLPDGTHKKGFVHRKGATRAFPAGHPQLVGTKWEQTGHPCLIPGSSFDGAAILFPKEGAYNSGCSVNHGSGRKIGRKEAKRKLEHKQEFLNNQMANVKRNLGGTEVRGIVINSKKVPLDECKEVYKDLDDVLSVLEAENIAEVKHRMYPVCNLKGID